MERRLALASRRSYSHGSHVTSLPVPGTYANIHSSLLGFKDGLETDTNGYIYAANLEDNSVSYFDPAEGKFYTLVRDPRFSWVDTFSVGFDGYLYFTDNQLWRRPVHWFGNDRRVKPYALFRVKLPNNGTKVV